MCERTNKLAVIKVKFQLVYNGIRYAGRLIRCAGQLIHCAGRLIARFMKTKSKNVPTVKKICKNSASLRKHRKIHENGGNYICPVSVIRDLS